MIMDHMKNILCPHPDYDDEGMNFRGAWRKIKKGCGAKDGGDEDGGGPCGPGGGGAALRWLGLDWRFLVFCRRAACAACARWALTSIILYLFRAIY